MMLMMILGNGRIRNPIFSFILENPYREVENLARVGRLLIFKEREFKLTTTAI